MILCKDLMFIFSLLPYLSRYCRSKNDHARLSYRISFMSTCSPYARVSTNFSKICTFLWPISVAIKCSASVSAPISFSVLNNVSLNTIAMQLNAKIPWYHNFITHSRPWLQLNFLALASVGRLPLGHGAMPHAPEDIGHNSKSEFIFWVTEQNFYMSLIQPINMKSIT